MVVLGSDGLFDNMWEEQLIQIVQQYMQQHAARGASAKPLNANNAVYLARLLSSTAHQNARDPNFRWVVYRRVHEVGWCAVWVCVKWVGVQCGCVFVCECGCA